MKRQRTGLTPRLTGRAARRNAAVLADLLAVMGRLRAPGGCPWDREQTHASLVKYAIEEAYELAEAVESGDDEWICEELGDLLLQVVFHGRIAAERKAFTFADIATGIARKLRRRHPHVFGRARVNDSREVLQRWESIKAAEKRGRGARPGETPLRPPDLPRSLPALFTAYRLLEKRPALCPDEKALRRALEKLDRRHLPAALQALAFLAWRAGLDPEAALRRENNRLLGKLTPRARRAKVRA